MMIQQKEISKMRRSTEYYREKIHKYRQHCRASTSPDRHSRAPSLDGAAGMGPGMDEQYSFTAGLSDADRESSVAPSEHLDETLSASGYTPGKRDTSGSSLGGSPDKTPRSHHRTPLSASKRSPMSASPMSALSDSFTTNNLKKLSVQHPER